MMIFSFTFIVLFGLRDWGDGSRWLDEGRRHRCLVPDREDVWHEDGSHDDMLVLLFSFFRTEHELGGSFLMILDEGEALATAMDAGLVVRMTFFLTLDADAPPG